LKSKSSKGLEKVLKSKKSEKCYLISRKEERKEYNTCDIIEHIVVLKQPTATMAKRTS